MDPQYTAALTITLIAWICNKPQHTPTFRQHGSP